MKLPAVARASFLSVIATAVKILTAVFTNKVLALYLGPSGFALIGQFQNFVGIASTLATGSINTGIVRYAASTSNDPAEYKQVIGTSFWIVLLSSVIVASVSVVASSALATRLLDDPSAQSVFWLFSAVVLISSLGTWILAILNSQRDISLYIRLSIIASLCPLITTVPLVAWFGVKGAMAGAALGPCLAGIAAVYTVRRTTYFPSGFHRIGWEKTLARGLAKYGLMTLVGGLLAHFVQLYIRDLLVARFGWQVAGLWQATIRISDYYLLGLTSALGILYLPALARLHSWRDTMVAVKSSTPAVMALAICAAAAMYVFRDFFIHVFLSASFAGARDLLPIQLLGDVIKIASWLVAYALLARGAVWQYMSAEALFALTYVAFASLLTERVGPEGAVYGYSIAYTAYLFCVVCFAARAALREERRS